MSGVCDGRCCAVFPLSLTRATLAEEVVSAFYLGTPRTRREAEKLSYMVLPLARPAALRRIDRYGLTGKLGTYGNDELFACRWWDEGTRRCTNYAARPHTCRDYPYSDPCRYCGYEVDAVTQLEWALDRAAAAMGAHPTALTLPG